VCGFGDGALCCSVFVVCLVFCVLSCWNFQVLYWGCGGVFGGVFGGVLGWFVLVFDGSHDNSSFGFGGWLWSWL